MDIEFIFGLIEIILLIFMIGLLVFAMFQKSVKKGILTIIGLILLFLGAIGFDKLCDFLLEEHLWLFILLLVALIVLAIYFEYKDKKNNKKG